jgi:hypothetical protein
MSTKFPASPTEILLFLSAGLSFAAGFMPIRFPSHTMTRFVDYFDDLQSMITAYQGEATIVDTETILIRAKDLTENYYDLEHSGSIPNWAGPSASFKYSVVL